MLRDGQIWENGVAIAQVLCEEDVSKCVKMDMAGGRFIFSEIVELKPDNLIEYLQNQGMRPTNKVLCLA